MTDPELAEAIRAGLTEAFPAADVRRSAYSIVPVVVTELSESGGTARPLILVYPAPGMSEERLARGAMAMRDHSINVLVAAKVSGTDVALAEPFEALTERVRDFLRARDFASAKWLRATGFVPTLSDTIVYLNGMTCGYKSPWAGTR